MPIKFRFPSQYYSHYLQRSTKKVKQKQNGNIDQKDKNYRLQKGTYFKSNTKSQQNYRVVHSQTSYFLLNIMINGIKPSQLDTRNRSLHIHYSKLSQITTGHCSFMSTFNKNFHAIVRRKKFNHIKWKHFKFNESQDQLWKQNQIVKDKIVKILSSKPKLHVSSTQSLRDFSKSNYFYQKKRFQTTIDRENPQIAKRILKAAGPLNHKKDSQDYKKTRQVVKRLQRFPILKRLQQSVQSSRMRFKTQDQFHRRNYSVSSKSMDPTMRLKTLV